MPVTCRDAGIVLSADPKGWIGGVFGRTPSTIAVSTMSAPTINSVTKRLSLIVVPALHVYPREDLVDLVADPIEVVVQVRPETLPLLGLLEHRAEINVGV